MEKIIVIILIVLILVLYQKNNEHLIIEDSQSTIINNVMGKFINDKLTSIPNINITNFLKIKNINFEKLILEYTYPIGSFYVQYPDSNVNLNTTGAALVTPFPESKYPAKLFGGVWIDMWNTDSVYFRTGSTDTAAFENSSRVNGLQDYAYRNISGYTSIAQASKGDGTATNPAQCDGNSGVFTKCEKVSIRADSGFSNDRGHQSIFNSDEYMHQIYGDSYTNYISDDEVRVKNRLIKVWKRIE